MKKEVIRWKIVNLNQKPRIIENLYKQPIYDMYEIELEYNTGEKEVTKVFCEHDTIEDLNIADIRLKNEFFGGRVKRLKEEQGRNDYIFLGRVMIDDDGRFAFDREYIMPNTQVSAQRYFDEKAYPALKQVFEQEKSSSNNQQQAQTSQSNKATAGKHYVVGDIHGMYGSYMEVMRKLNDKDTLLIIGDVIDRGRNGIKILQDIMERKKDGKNVIFFLGNHEMQMIFALDIIKKYNLNQQQVEAFCQAIKASKDAEDLISSKKEAERWKAKFYYTEEQYKSALEKYRQRERNALASVSSIHLEESEMEMLKTWLKDNHGQVTWDEYSQLSKKEQDEIYEFLTHSNIYGQKVINNKKIFFVHACPDPRQAAVDIFRNLGDTGFKYAEDRKKVAEYCLQMRDSECKDVFKMWKKAGYFTIYGHSPKPEEQVKEVDDENGCICIDAGCGHKGTQNKLALYCVEDSKTVEFIEQKEDDIGIMQGNNDGDHR